jgi:hypothetical protein
MPSGRSLLESADVPLLVFPSEPVSLLPQLPR